MRIIAAVLVDAGPARIDADAAVASEECRHAPWGQPSQRRPGLGDTTMTRR
jgi:hypothetical protein